MPTFIHGCMQLNYTCDNASQWKSGKSDPRSLKNPWTDRHLNLHGWLRRGPGLCKISSLYDYPLPPKYAKMRIEWLASFFSELELTHAHVRYRPICRCSSVCLSSVCLSVTFVRPTQAIGIFGNVSMPFNTLVIWRHPGKILLRSSQGNPSVGRVKHNRGIAKYSDFGYFRGYISETVQDRR